MSIRLRHVNTGHFVRVAVFDTKRAKSGRAAEIFAGMLELSPESWAEIEPQARAIGWEVLGWDERSQAEAAE